MDCTSDNGLRPQSIALPLSLILWISSNAYSFPRLDAFTRILTRTNDVSSVSSESSSSPFCCLFVSSGGRPSPGAGGVIFGCLGSVMSVLNVMQ